MARAVNDIRNHMIAEKKIIASYIRSCRDANIDCTVTIDKSKTHIILNALEKRYPKNNVSITNSWRSTRGRH
jgi:hypothetical protein